MTTEHKDSPKWVDPKCVCQPLHAPTQKLMSLDELREQLISAIQKHFDVDRPNLAYVYEGLSIRFNLEQYSQELLYLVRSGAKTDTQNFVEYEAITIESLYKILDLLDSEAHNA